MFLALGIRLLHMRKSKKMEVKIEDIVEILGGGSPDF
jgi:hypothetical protein